MLDLFCGRWGWSRAFAERGWECVGVDLVAPPEIPDNCDFYQANILDLKWSETVRFGWGFEGYSRTMGTRYLQQFDFICASSPCEQFSVHGMKHFHPNPPYPELGIKLFNHTRSLCEASGVPYVMENVRAAQQFVGNAVNHCGPFYLWGSGVPPILPQGIDKGTGANGVGGDGERSQRESASARKRRWPATIPPELSACVADYAMRLMEVPA